VSNESASPWLSKEYRGVNILMAVGEVLDGMCMRGKAVWMLLGNYRVLQKRVKALAGRRRGR